MESGRRTSEYVSGRAGCVCEREREPDRETETDGPTDRQIEHYRDRSETLGQAEALWD